MKMLQIFDRKARHPCSAFFHDNIFPETGNREGGIERVKRE